jgi:hypothetical protein
LQEPAEHLYTQLNALNLDNWTFSKWMPRKSKKLYDIAYYAEFTPDANMFNLQLYCKSSLLEKKKNIYIPHTGDDTVLRSIIESIGEYNTMRFIHQIKLLPKDQMPTAENIRDLSELRDDVDAFSEKVEKTLCCSRCKSSNHQRNLERYKSEYYCSVICKDAQ